MLWSIGSNGHSWASTACDLYGMYLGYSATILDPSSASHRAYGFQLRCLSE
ncbi:hypothetical protein [uncultured Rikenella sp.]|uniref:hypothetical protein n=1 Tax=uncultured Rikenella sp. TaxID=368003 RepID=UPI0025D040EF|nr:hypothetical protein [uncultured Rikenella sp.]